MAEYSNKKAIINFYKSQLQKFSEIGIGKKTEFGVNITSSLIKITKFRLKQVQKMKSIDFLIRKDNNVN
jgi:hypothetical protein